MNHFESQSLQIIIPLKIYWFGNRWPSPPPVLDASLATLTDDFAD